MFRRLTQLALLLLALDATLCLAEEETEEATESRWRLGAAFGYGVRSNPLVQSDDIPIIVDLDIAWFGDRWFFDNGDLGVPTDEGGRLGLTPTGVAGCYPPGVN